MISDSFMIFLLGSLIFLVINLIAYARTPPIPVLSVVVLIGTCMLAVDTLEDFGDYWVIALVLVLTNVTIPMMCISKASEV